MTSDLAPPRAVLIIRNQLNLAAVYFFQRPLNLRSKPDLMRDSLVMRALGQVRPKTGTMFGRI